MYRPSDISRNACFSLWSQKSRLALDSKKMASISPRQLAKSATSSALCIFTNGTLKEATVRRLPLRQPPPASPTHADIPRRLQLRQASKDFEWAHAFRIRL